MTDFQLIARAAGQDDRTAFGELVRRHQSAVRSFLRRLTGDAAWADDLAQETFLRAYRSLGGYRGEGQFTTWLFGIAYNQHRNDRRKHREQAFAPVDLPVEEPTPDGNRAVELSADLQAAISQLGPDEQTALHLFYQEGLAHPEIAAIMHCPLGTVKTHLARAKEKLRPLLRAWTPPV